MEVHTADLQSQIKELLANDDIGPALELLIQYLESSEDLNKAVVQSAAFKRLMNELDQGIIDWEQAHRIKSRIIVSIMNIVNAAEHPSGDSRIYGEIFSEVGELHRSIEDLPREQGQMYKFMNRQTSMLILVVVLVTALGTGFTIGDLRLITNGDSFFSTGQSEENEVNALSTTEQENLDLEAQIQSLNQELIAANQEVETYRNENNRLERINQKPNVAIRDGSRFSNITDHIYFFNQDGNKFEFSAEFGFLSFAGKGTLTGNKIYLKGNGSGTLTLLEGGRKLVGQVVISDNYSRITRNVNLRLN